MQPTRDKDSRSRLDTIIEEASKLSVEKQELILAVAEGMVFTRRHLEKKEVQVPPKKSEKLVRITG